MKTSTHLLTFGAVSNRAKPSDSQIHDPLVCGPHAVSSHFLTTGVSSSFRPYAARRLPPALTPDMAKWLLLALAGGRTSIAIKANLEKSGWHTADASQLCTLPPEQLLKAVLDASRSDTPSPDAGISGEGDGDSYGVPNVRWPAASALRASSAAPVLALVPQCVVGDTTTAVNIDGHIVTVLTSLESPRVLVLENLLSAYECDALVAQASAQLAPSVTLNSQTGEDTVNDYRTSRGCFLPMGSSEVVTRVDARLAAFSDWPIQKGEALQILHYGPGAQYKPHHDHFDPQSKGSQGTLKRGGQRVATIIIYLNTPEEGGSTVFPRLGLHVHARKGNAVFFSYPSADVNALTLHGGSPVIKGEKWVATRWMREQEFK